MELPHTMAGSSQYIVYTGKVHDQSVGNNTSYHGRIQYLKLPAIQDMPQIIKIIVENIHTRGRQGIFCSEQVRSVSVYDKRCLQVIFHFKRQYSDYSLLFIILK